MRTKKRESIFRTLNPNPRVNLSRDSGDRNKNCIYIITTCQRKVLSKDSSSMIKEKEKENKCGNFNLNY